LEYHNFLSTKRYTFEPSGFDVDIDTLNNMLFDFQRDIVKWALKKGKCALFMDTGLGKTICQLEWANQICKKENANVLILAPLAVSRQTVQEGKKFGIDVNTCRTQSDVKDGINITNYEMLDHFDTDKFIGIVLDESSIIKHFMGKTTSLIIDKFRNTKYKLACTATPSPNDYVELGTHSDFLGIMSRSEMLASFFINDAKEGQWRMKRHAEDKFWEWVSEWAMVLKNPKDLGYDAIGYDLPKLNIKTILVESEESDNGSLFGVDIARTLEERREARKESIPAKIDKINEIIKDMDNCLVWCDFNDESNRISKSLPFITEVKGSDPSEHKEKSMIDFANGDIKYLVSKPSICGFGMNFQICNNIIFFGLSDSYERFYQAIRRCWRFGQEKQVNVYVIISEREMAVLQNIRRKQEQHNKMTDSMLNKTTEILKSELKNTTRIEENYIANESIIMPKWVKTEEI
jgi:superfamily II DNA or RNA helicase